MKENLHKNQFLEKKGIVNDAVNDIEALYESHSNLSKIIRKHIISCLKEILLVTPKHKISICESESEDYGSLPTIAYDGGNHPEYASNVYSKVSGISLHEEGSTDEAQILIDCEDECGMSIGRVWSLDGLYEILKFAEWYVFDRKKEEEEE